MKVRTEIRARVERFLSLTDEILAAPGHLLIQGGPGCGKTTIALLKAAATLDWLEPEQQVLFLSFSRAAVRQISDRMRGTINRARDRLEVRTFHSFFLELVRAHGPLLTGTLSSFIVPDRERQLRADFDGDWGQETHRLACEEGRYVFDRLASTAAALLSAIPVVCARAFDRRRQILVLALYPRRHERNAMPIATRQTLACASRANA